MILFEDDLSKPRRRRFHDLSQNRLVWNLECVSAIDLVRYYIDDVSFTISAHVLISENNRQSIIAVILADIHSRQPQDRTIKDSG